MMTRPMTMARDGAVRGMNGLRARITDHENEEQEGQTTFRLQQRGGRAYPHRSIAGRTKTGAQLRTPASRLPHCHHKECVLPSSSVPVEHESPPPRMSPASPPIRVQARETGDRARDGPAIGPGTPEPDDNGAWCENGSSGEKLAA